MSTKRQVFYSFHYESDSWRVAQIRNIGATEGNEPVSDNDWEEVASRGEEAIKRWIDEQMKHRSCTIVLIGSNTANRKWINYEIKKSWHDNGMGAVGIYVHGLKNQEGETSTKGENPFVVDVDIYSEVKCYNPEGANSTERYDWIKNNLAGIVEEAIDIRRRI